MLRQWWEGSKPEGGRGCRGSSALVTLATDPAAAMAAVAAVAVVAAVAAVGGRAEGEGRAGRCSVACQRPNTHAISAHCAVYSTKYGCSHGGGEEHLMLIIASSGAMVVYLPVGERSVLIWVRVKRE